jgi:hypothetical protein
LREAESELGDSESAQTHLRELTGAVVAAGVYLKIKQMN